MTYVNKAIAFAEECLKWTDVTTAQKGSGTLIYSQCGLGFLLDSLADLNGALHQFLGERFFIQINRGTTSLFKWSVIVGLQNRVAGPKGIFDHGHGEGDDMLDAIFDACVAAARIYSGPS